MNEKPASQPARNSKQDVTNVGLDDARECLTLFREDVSADGTYHYCGRPLGHPGDHDV